MGPNQLLLLLFLLSLSSSSSSDLLPFAGMLSLASLCARTDYPTLCLQVASTYGHAYPSPPDAVALLSMHLDMATHHTLAAAEAAAQLLPKAKKCAREEGAIRVCKSQFGDAVSDMKTVRDAVRDRDAGTTNSYLSGVITYYSTCDDAFSEIPLANPLAKEDHFLTEIVSNALALVPVALS